VREKTLVSLLRPNQKRRRSQRDVKGEKERARKREETLSFSLYWLNREDLEFSFPFDATQKAEIKKRDSQPLDALVPKPPVFLLTDSYHTTVYSCKQHHIHNFNQNMLNILNAKHHAYN
jgi:hypothetical protein